MNRHIYCLGLFLLPVACASQAKGAPGSTLLASQCSRTITGSAVAGISVRVEAPRPVATSEYLQLTIFAMGGGRDSAISHIVGSFDSLPGLTPGLYRLRVRALGYQTATGTLRVAAGESWCVTARLADAIVLKPAS